MFHRWVCGDDGAGKRAAGLVSCAAACDLDGHSGVCAAHSVQPVRYGQFPVVLVGHSGGGFLFCVYGGLRHAAGQTGPPAAAGRLCGFRLQRRSGDEPQGQYDSDGQRSFPSGNCIYERHESLCARCYSGSGVCRQYGERFRQRPASGVRRLVPQPGCPYVSCGRFQLLSGRRRGRHDPGRKCHPGPF